MNTKRLTLAALVAASTAALVLSGCASAEESTELSEGPTGVAESPTTDTSTTDDAADESASADHYDERDVRGQNPQIDYEQAIAIALDTAGGGFVYDLELDHSDDADAWVYEVSVRDGNTDHELVLSSSSGDVLEHEREDEDDDDPEREIAFDDMNPEEALQIASDEAGDDIVEGWALAWEDGELRYDIDVREGDDFEISVADGTISRD